MTGLEELSRSVPTVKAALTFLRALPSILPWISRQRMNFPGEGGWMVTIAFVWGRWLK